MEDETGIEIEELAANKELEILTFPYELLGEKGNDLLITGVALTEGVWKNVIYSANEIKKVAKQLIGKPLLVEHGNTKEFGSESVGKVEKSYYEPSLRGIVFQAHISNPLAKRLVKRDILPAVSCSTWMDKRPVNETIRVGTGYIFAELSLVRIPACDRCFIFHKEQLSHFEGIKGKGLKVKKEKETVRDVINMEFEDDVETLSEIEEEEEELSEIEELEAPKLYAVLELPDEESLESLRRVKRVVSYYYGYPYYAPYYRGYKSPYKYPYKYPYRKKASATEGPVLLAVVELEGKDELQELRRTYKVGKYYYGRYGYPYGYPSKYGYRYPGYGYPYQYKYKYLYPKKLSAEDLSILQKMVGEALPEFEEHKPKELPRHEGFFSPNPENCKKITCPVCDKEFPDEKAFLEHWAKEHKEKYGEFKETMTILWALSQMVDLAKGDTKITKMKTGRFVVFVDTGKVGFGQWKIIGNFATEKEAKDAAAKAGKGKEEKQAEEKDEKGCIVGKEEWSEEEKKCKPISKEEQSAYTDFIKKCMKEGKTMKECAAQWGKEEKSAYTDFIGKCRKEGKSMKECAEAWKKQGKPEKKQGEVVCPACKKKFPDEKALAEHWKKEHKEKYGPLKKGYKYPEKTGLAKKAYYYYKHKGKYYPYYYQKGIYYRKYKKPKK